MIKGPKAILSSAIANALDEYFVVDSGSIESNLLKDAKIVLRHVKLREQVTYIPLNSAGKSTRITITGSVDEVSFTWAWSVGDVMWVTDAMLTITGAKFQASLEHEDIHKDEGTAAPTSEDNEEGLAGSFVDPNTIDEASAKKIEKQKGGLSGFVERQVKMVMDMLTLRLVDFELRINLPQPAQLKDAGDDLDVGLSSTSACDQVLAMSIGKIELLSFGRDGQGKENQATRMSVSKLKQRINLNSFACAILLEGKDGGSVSYPLLDPFSYSADVLRIGERFGGFLTGLEILGLGEPTDQCPDLASLTSGSGLAVHMGATQMDTLLLLSVMILAPPDENPIEDQKEQTEGSSTLSTKTSSSESDENVFGAHDPSYIVLPLSSVSLTLFKEHHFVVSGINMRYKADGTVCMMQTSKMEYKSDANGQATLVEVVMTMRPSMKMTIGCFEELLIKDALLLKKPIHSCEISYEGSTVTMRLLDELNVVTFSKEEDPAQTASVTQKDSAETGAYVSMPNLPCNINLCIEKGMQMKKSEDGSMTKVGKLNFFALKEPDCAKIAIQFETFRNYLVSMNAVSCCGTLPKDQVDYIADFMLAANEIKVISGHTTDEWSEAFQPRGKQTVKQSTKRQPAKSSVKQPKAQQSNATVRMPHARIEKLKVVIGMGSNKFGVKETTLVIKPFEGKAETVSKDIINYYTKACLARAPDFISNAEVLGLNVMDSTTGMLSTWAGLGLGSTFSAGGGVAAITAFDAIKGAVDAGKRHRGVGEEEAYRPGDFFRGLVQAAGEATMHGAAIRGSQGKGNIIDWAVGATSDSTEYVKENKNRLGAAGAGGGGFLLGMALGGPIGAVVGGLVATATTGRALEAIDERGNKKSEQNKKLALPAEEEKGVLLCGDSTDAVDEQIDSMLKVQTKSSKKLEAEIQAARSKA